MDPCHCLCSLHAASCICLLSEILICSIARPIFPYFNKRGILLLHRIADYMLIILVNRGQVAELIGAGADEVVMVPNTTHGINDILRNFEWKEGDIVLDGMTNHTLAFILFD